MDDLECLARAWLVCDPNRQPADPDEPLTHGTMIGEPRWKWFVPRADAMLEFLNENGFTITRTQ